MISRNVTIKNSVGLHARPATFFIQKANSYKSSIWVEKEDCRVNAKSLLGVLSLGIVKGMTITLMVTIACVLYRDIGLDVSAQIATMAFFITALSGSANDATPSE